MPRVSAVTPDQFKTFGELLKFLRHRAGLTQLELSIAVNYSEGQISRMEHNERAPDASVIAARFVPALDLEREPNWTARLLELASSHTVVETPEQENESQLRHHNLPLQLTSFVGREKELEEIESWVVSKDGARSARLLTLTGPGGVGKTRLALQAASELLDSFRDGVWWVDLAPLSDAALVPQTVASVLAIKQEIGRSLLATLTDALRGKQTLIVLDNCEHLVVASAQLAETLLRGCPGLVILATSREGLNSTGEQVFPVPTLSTPEPHSPPSVQELLKYEAVRLLVERANAVLPEFVMNRENAPAIHKVALQLDGIPLAIELAAAQLRMLSVAQLAERLADRFHLLTGGKRNALPRHQTLAAMMDWSYDLLTVPERILLQRLAVFAGGWTLEAAEAVCAGGEIGSKNVLEMLMQLLNKSLVIAERQEGKEARYSMLETIRQYAVAKLIENNEEDNARRRHAEYYMALVEKRTTAAWISTDANRTDPMELDNLRGALNWSQFVAGSAELHMRLAVGSGSFFWDRKMRSEVRGWLENALAHADAEGVEYSSPKAFVLLLLGEILATQGDYTSGYARMAQSAQLFEKLGDIPVSAHALLRLGWVARERGNTKTARLHIKKSLAIYRQLDDRAGIASATVTLGEVAVMEGDTAEARILLEAGYALFQALGDPAGMGWSLNHLGHVARLNGEFKLARQLFEESLPLFRQVNPQYVGVRETSRELGETALAEGAGAQATKHFKDVLVLFLDRGGQVYISWCLAGLAGAAVLEGEPARAAFLWGAAEQLRQSIGVRHGPASDATRERLMTQARGQLGQAAFDAAWAQGQAVPLEQVITLLG